MPSILQQAVVATRDLLKGLIQQTTVEVGQLTDWLGQLYHETVKEETNTLQVSYRPPTTFSEEDVVFIKDKCLHLVQLHIYLR